MDIYQHFRKDEHPFIDQILTWREQVERTYRPRLTDFLDPREQQILAMLVGTEADDLQLKQFGGGKYTERKRALIAPFYEPVTEDMFQLALLETSYPNKFVTISHRDVLGAFLSLGLKRTKLGDIFVGDRCIQMVTTGDIAPFVMVHLTRIKHAKVVFKEKPLATLQEKQHDWDEKMTTVASLRLDAVLKSIYNMSRKDAASVIAAEHVKVNFKVIDDAKFILQEGDMLSVRGKGRSKLVRINGKTKKGKWRITAAVLRF